MASPPVRPGYSPVGVDHGRAGSQDGVCGMGEDSRAVFGTDAVEEVVEVAEWEVPRGDMNHLVVVCEAP